MDLKASGASGVELEFKTHFESLAAFYRNLNELTMPLLEILKTIVHAQKSGENIVPHLESLDSYASQKGQGFFKKIIEPIIEVDEELTFSVLLEALEKLDKFYNLLQNVFESLFQFYKGMDFYKTSYKAFMDFTSPEQDPQEYFTELKEFIRGFLTSFLIKLSLLQYIDL